jgi:hypothetical protein
MQDGDVAVAGDIADLEQNFAHKPTSS